MNFSLKIPLATIFVLFLTLFINILSLKYSIETHFPVYLSKTLEEKNNININSEGLQAVASIQELDEKEQKDYQSAISELDNISSSLQNLSKNPELYIGKEGVTEVSDKSFYVSFNKEIFSILKEQTNNTILSFLTNPLSFKKNSAEGQFIWAVLKNFFVINAIWFTIIALFYILWIHRVFRPIRIIMEKIRNFSDKKIHEPILYNRKNEFKLLIDELNLSYQSIKDQEQIRNQFLSDLSHEIRTPITAISGLLEGINDRIIELDKTTISILQSEISRLIKITGTIMDHEKFLSKKINSDERVKIGLKEETNKIITQYEYKMSNNGQKIINNFSEKNYLLADFEQYVQLLHNIFSNFCKYSGKNTTLICEYSENSTEKILTFSDNGVGVSKKNISKLKEKFFRENSARTQNSEEISMGIGLSIVEKIMSLHNGNLVLKQNSPNGLILQLIFIKEKGKKI